MPEGDTVWLTAHRLGQALRGRVVAHFDLRVPALALVDLSGTTLMEVLARGKHILMRFDDGHTLHSHLRMDGSWRINPALAPPAASPARARPGARSRPNVGWPDAFDVRAVVGNAQWVCSGHRVHDLAIARTTDEDRWVGHLGPDVLGPDWDPERARANVVADPGRTVVEALLDQRNLAGVGNMYAAELLFMARVNPFTPIRDVPDPVGLPALAYRLLRANRDHPEQSTTGRTARGEQHWVYVRTGQPCRRCGVPIVTAGFGALDRRRATFWCPRCQPAPVRPAT